MESHTGLMLTPDHAQVKVDDVPNVEIAKKQWAAYQELCRGILDDSDYQKITVKQRDENGQFVRVEREFKKKSAWQKLGRAFNVDTHIIVHEFQRSKNGRITEAYYCVRASLPNGRSVESDALCSRAEKGKSNVSDHTIIATAKTRATNRAISELVGAGEVSSEEMSAEYKVSDDPDHHYINNNSTFKGSVSNPVGNSIGNSIPAGPPKIEVPTIDIEKDSFVTAAEIEEPKPEDDPVRNTCQEIKNMLDEEGIPVTKMSMRIKVVQLIKKELLPEENKPVLFDFIEKHCPEELE
ncbi:MAG: hypothetical protein E7Z77_02305 [Methanobrevibacter sp.]|uniref:hypothetical protein n=1 Tax=Methanobrevibacter sp. TaxID=66852 RepID=UPI0025F19981|nr:hypothetical protein [Methanobrevibacter sp.]MBE6508226.1 hypothetical protein [Methanobrevibacter sp.]